MKITKNPVLDSWELAESEERRRPHTHRAAKHCDRSRILIVDDEESVRFVTERVLRSKLSPNLILDMASNGQEAVAQFAKWQHKVIIMDLTMPILSGEEAANQIIDMCEEFQWEVPSIIFRTGYAPPGDVRNLVACDPGHCLLRKPVRNQTLVLAVAKRLGHKSPG